jgi:hypothetical protein
MEDAKGDLNRPLLRGLIQETGQEQRLARMAGQFSLDRARFSMEADSGSRIFLTRQGESR